MKTVHTIGALATVIAVLASGPVVASDDTKVRTRTVTYADLDLNSEAGARTMLRRINKAARKVCFIGDQAISFDVDELDCRRKAVRDTVRRLDAPFVTAAYSGDQRPVQLARR